MRPSRRFHPSPAFVVSALALFFALGGSALAVGDKLGASQPRCAAGAVRGIAVVVGDPKIGIANTPDKFTSANVYFQRKFNCTGGAVLVRRAGPPGVYEVKFAGNTAPDAIANVYANDGATASVFRQPDGAFRVFLRGAVTENNKLVPLDVPFMVVAV